MAEQSPGSQARRYFLGLGAAAPARRWRWPAASSCPSRGPSAPPEPSQPEVEQPPSGGAGPAAAARRDPQPRRRAGADLGGANAGVGQSIANAANLALLDAGGERIRITVYDTARGGAAAAANQALADGNGLFLGPLLADDVRAVAPVARRAGVPVISFSNDTSVAGNGVYLMGFTPAQSIARVVGHARGKRPASGSAR